MDNKVLELQSGIRDIQLTSKLLIKRLNKVIDTKDRECVCHRESESIGNDLRKLQSHVKGLEGKIKTRDESSLHSFKILTGRLDSTEGEHHRTGRDHPDPFQTKNTDIQNERETNENKIPVQRNDDVETVPLDQANQDLHERETNNVFESMVISKNAPNGMYLFNNAMAKIKDIQTLNSNTENIKSENKTSGDKSEVPIKHSTRVETKTKSKSTFTISKPNFIKSKQPVEVRRKDTTKHKDEDSSLASQAYYLDEFPGKYLHNRRLEQQRYAMIVYNPNEPICIRRHTSHDVETNVRRHKRKGKGDHRRKTHLHGDLQEVKVKTGDISYVKAADMASTKGQHFELEPQQAMTLEEFAAKQKRKKNKNADEIRIAKEKN